MANDLFYNSVSLLLHGDGADLSTAITDNSPTPKTVTAVSGAKISTDVWTGRIGTASIKLNGSSDYCTVPYSAAFDFPGDFSLEATIYLTAYGASPYSATVAANYLATGVNTGWQLRVDGTASSWTTLYIYTGLNALAVTGLAFALNTKYAIGVFRTGSTITATVNGAVVGTFTNSDALVRSSASTLYVGDLNTAGAYFLPGYIDELRLTKGVGRQTGAYTVSAVAFPDAVEIALVELPAVAPMPTLMVYGGAAVALTAPSPTVSSFSGALVSLTAPMATIVAYLGDSITATAPMGQLYFTGHNSLGANALNAVAPMPTLTGAFGDVAALTAPMPTLVFAGTGTALAQVAITAPMPAVVAAGTGGGIAQTPLSAPMATLVGYGGSLISVTVPSPTLVTTGTGGAAGQIVITCPLFQVVASATAQNHGSIALVVPMPQLGTANSIWALAPMAQLVAVGSATVAVPVYDSYSLNLNHTAIPNVIPVDELTHYTNFPFDRIVRWNGSYFGVAKDGLYLLQGTTDYATPTPLPITWNWRTGITDFKTPNRKTVAEVFFGGRLGNAVTITLYVGETGANAYTYTTVRDATVQNYRQSFGLGAQSRYFALGASSSTELALDNVEFNVATLARRV